METATHSYLHVQHSILQCKVGESSPTSKCRVSSLWKNHGNLENEKKISDLSIVMVNLIRLDALIDYKDSYEELTVNHLLVIRASPCDNLR